MTKQGVHSQGELLGSRHAHACLSSTVIGQKSSLCLLQAMYEWRDRAHLHVCTIWVLCALISIHNVVYLHMFKSAPHMLMLQSGSQAATYMCSCCIVTFIMCGFALAILSTSSSICSLQLTDNLGRTEGILRGF